MKQAEYNRLDFGAQYTQDWFTFALLAATNPSRSNLNSHFLTSMNAVVGVAWEDFKFGYSYDFNLSRLVVSSSGAHEISFTIDLPEKKQHASKFRVVNCPQF